MLAMTASKSVPLLRSHELEVTGNSEPERAGFSRLCSVFILMGTIIFATDCVSPLLWMLVNLQPNLKLISSSWIVSYDIHYVVSNLLSLPIFLISLSLCCHLLTFIFLNLSYCIHADRLSRAVSNHFLKWFRGINKWIMLLIISLTLQVIRFLSC